MKKALLPAALVLTASLSHGALTWTAGGDGVSTFQEANWVDSTTSLPPVAGTVDPNVSINDDLIVTFGTPGGPGGGGAHLQLGNSGSLTLSGGVFRMSQGAGAGIHADGAVGGARSSIDVSGSAELLAQFLADQTITVDGTSLLTLYGGGNPINNATIDFGSSWTGSLTFLNETPGAVTSEHLGKLTVGGQPAVEGTNVLIVSDGGAGAILTVIPEPSATLLGTFGLLALLRRRR